MDLKKKKSYKKHERTTIFHETKKKKKKDKNNFRHTPIYILFTTRNQFLRSHEQQSTTIWLCNSANAPGMRKRGSVKYLSRSFPPFHHPSPQKGVRKTRGASGKQPATDYSDDKW